MGGKLGTGLFLESPSLCTSQAPLTSVPSSVLENDFKPRSVKQLGRKRTVTGTVWRRGAVSKFEKIQEHDQERAQGKNGSFDSAIPSFLQSTFLKS